MTDENVRSNNQSDSTSVSLLQRIKRDENQAWESFVDLYAPLIYARCRRRWKLSAHESESIGQEVFASVARKIKDFQRERTGSFRKWIRVITDNKCKDYMRRQNVVVPAGGSEAQKFLANVPDELDGCLESEEDTTERAILMRQAMSAVENEFSQRDWQLFWDVTVENKQRQDVASCLGVSDNVVYLAISRIKKRLREIYVGLIDDELITNNLG